MIRQLSAWIKLMKIRYSILIIPKLIFDFQHYFFWPIGNTTIWAESFCLLKMVDFKMPDVTAPFDFIMENLIP